MRATPYQNQQNPQNITFSAEYENENSTNYLDLTITKLEHKHAFKI